MLSLHRSRVSKRSHSRLGGVDRARSQTRSFGRNEQRKLTVAVSTSNPQAHEVTSVSSCGLGRVSLLQLTHRKPSPKRQSSTGGCARLTPHTPKILAQRRF